MTRLERCDLVLREWWVGSLPGLLISRDLTPRDVLEGWWGRAMCRILGHRWEPQYYDYPDALYLEGHNCERCWRFEPHRTAHDKAGSTDGA